MVSANFPIIVALTRDFLPFANYVASLAVFAHVVNLLSMLFYVYAIKSLGTSLTVLPEYNTVKTEGAYKYSRYPLYLVYIIQYCTQVFIFQAWSILLCSFIQICLILIRAKHEERILSENNEIYKEYLKKTKWINIKLGGIWR